MRAYIDIPYEIPEDASDFIITFDLPDVNDALVEYAYKATGEDTTA